MAHVGFVQGKLFRRGGFFFFQLHLQNARIFIPQIGMETVPSSVEVWGLTTGLSGNFPEVAFELSLEGSAGFTGWKMQGEEVLLKEGEQAAAQARREKSVWLIGGWASGWAGR